jgi:hypothetical protein
MDDGVIIYAQTMGMDRIREVRTLFYKRHHDRRVK